MSPETLNAIATKAESEMPSDARVGVFAATDTHGADIEVVVRPGLKGFEAAAAYHRAFDGDPALRDSFGVQLRYVLALLAAIMFTTACGGVQPPAPPGTPTPVAEPTKDPRLVDALKVIELACPGTVADPIARAVICAPLVTKPLMFADCLCSGVYPEPTATSTAVPTVAPTTAPSPIVTGSPAAPPAVTPTPPVVRIEPTLCDGRASVYIGKVRQEMANWKAARPFLFEGDMLVWCAAGHEADYPCPISQDVYLLGVADALKKYRLEGVLDGDSGDMVVADATTPVGKGFAESFHPISSWDDFRQSGRLVQAAPYLGYCEPRWLGWK